jgi:hypothetical protein
MTVSPSTSNQFILSKKVIVEIVLFISVFTVALGFAFYTKSAWEDWYITYRASKNLAVGNGLVYQEGQRIHSFTSPLGTLIPAALNFITLNKSDDLVLWLYRIISSMVLGFTSIMLLRFALLQRFHLGVIIFILSMFCFSPKIVAFSNNGMETAFFMLALSLNVYLFCTDTKRPHLWLGILWAFLMWIRPDGCIYGGAIAGGFLLFPAGVKWAANRKHLFQIYLRSLVIALPLYLPWLIWAWLYYGTPIPHTVFAKGLINTGSSTGYAFLPLSVRLKIYFTVYVPGWIFGVDPVFMPHYYVAGGWKFRLLKFYNFMSLSSAVLSLFPVRSAARAISVAFVLCHFYLFALMPVCFPWYIPGSEILAIIAFGFLCQHIYEFISAYAAARQLTSLQRKMFSISASILPLIAIVYQVSLFSCVAFQLRIQQEVVENGNRMQIGLWLKDNAETKMDTVFSEPIGYIGFFSNLKILDFPGLTSPEMVAARRKLKTDNFTILIDYLEPDWVVLRPGEVKKINAHNPLLLNETYKLARHFSVVDKVNSYEWLPGRGALLADSEFFVFKRNVKKQPSVAEKKVP